MAVAVFSYSAFIARYPEFTAVSPTLLGAYFVEAGLYLNNTDCSPVSNVTTRGLLLNMLTAHIAFLNGALAADSQPRPVGRISDASEGSVSAGFEGLNALSPAGSAGWYQQSQYGAAFWQATVSLRSARYIPRPCFNRFGFGRRF